MNKIIISVVIIVAIVAITLFAFNSNKKTNSPQSNLAQSDGAKGTTMNQTQASALSFPGKLPADQIENKKAVIKTDKGTIEIALWADKAPLSVSNFVYLANKSFYNGLTFHRVEPDFVVQGGDPSGNGTGDPGYKFSDETVQGNYTAGTVAMANSGPNTNGSQFFIDLSDNSQKLTKSYNLFGEVTSGMDVVQKLVVGDKMNSVTIVSSK